MTLLRHTHSTQGIIAHMISHMLIRNASLLLTTFHAKQDLMQIHVTSLIIDSGASPEGSGQNILHPCVYFVTLS